MRIDPKQVLENLGVHTKEIGPRAPYLKTDNAGLTPVLSRTTNHQEPTAVTLAGIPMPSSQPAQIMGWILRVNNPGYFTFNLLFIKGFNLDQQDVRGADYYTIDIIVIVRET